MDKVIAYPKKQLLFALRVVLFLSIISAVFSVFEFIASSFNFWWIFLFIASFLLLIFMYIKSVLHAVYFVIDREELFVYRSKELIVKAPIRAVMYSKFSSKNNKYKGVTLFVNDLVFRASNLEYESYDRLFKQLLLKCKIK